MTAPECVLSDPVDTIVTLVSAADPDLAPELTRRIIEDVGGGRVKLRRLATALADNSLVLTTGRSPAPRAAGELLLALRAAGADRIAPPRCADCGRDITSIQRRSEHWYCSPCVTHPKVCAGCGQQRQVASRDRRGRPRCNKCPDQDAREPRAALVEIITGIDPDLSAQAVAAAIEQTVIKPAHLQKLVWAFQQAPDLLTGGGAKAPFPMVLRLINALCDAGATHIQRPACPRCRRVVTLSKQRDGLRICRNCCARANAVACGRCGTVREPAARDADGRPLCPYCVAKDPANLEECVRCGRRRQVSTRVPDGPLCPTCTPPNIATCSVCGRTGPCLMSKTTGQLRCRSCSRRWARCAQCGQRRPVRAGTPQQPLCASCAVPDATFWKICPNCGTTGRLTSGACSRCHLHQELNDLLSDPSIGRVRPELRLLHQTLAATDPPATVLKWLSGPTPRTVLTELATGARPLTHKALDELPTSKPLTHLRSVLVATQALPARDEHLAQLECWISQTVAARPDLDQKQLLHRYGFWHVLRRLRQRISGHTTHNQAVAARSRITAAAAFLDWLTDRNLTLTSCTRGDLDQWMIEATLNQHGQTGPFIRWANNQKLTSLTFPATRWTGPSRPLDSEGRWDNARRLLHDSTLKPEDRLAGLLVLLYAQQPAAISRLTLEHIHIHNTQVQLRLGREPILLPEPLAALALHVVGTRYGHATIGNHGTSPWLFPGGRPGHPISPYRLTERLHQIGIHAGPARSTALFHLATELPAAVLARLLGIHIKVAVAWQHASTGDWMTYAADVSRRQPTPPQIPSR
jgi:hypothetical protein